MASDIERFEELTKRSKALNEKKIRLEEQLSTRKKDLGDLVRKIKDEGYDPTKLKDIIEEKEKGLKQQIDAFEKDLTEVSQKLSAIEV